VSDMWSAYNAPTAPLVITCTDRLGILGKILWQCDRAGHSLFGRTFLSALWQLLRSRERACQGRVGAERSEGSLGHAQALPENVADGAPISPHAVSCLAVRLSSCRRGPREPFSPAAVKWPYERRADPGPAGFRAEGHRQRSFYPRGG